jgi:hypothetical protein
VCEACVAAGSCAPAMTGPSCTTAHASASACDGQGACGETQCDPGYLDCDSDKTDGCETPFGVSNCGSCESGGSLYLDCDGNTANGCESSPSAPSTCGGCGTQCGAAFTCDEGSPGAYACIHE